MRTTRVSNSISNLNQRQTSFERKINRLAHDPIRMETGAAVNYGESIGAIKAVRLG